MVHLAIRGSAIAAREAARPITRLNELAQSV
jgi:hypothetical protein